MSSPRWDNKDEERSAAEDHSYAEQYLCAGRAVGGAYRNALTEAFGTGAFSLRHYLFSLMHF
ncbi:MAG: hypothetical protein AYP45_09615 [Candidatus Brocadia carolinensis]|uniref:Uncharacterized protein n=1 Tax=Candidatus Brocadia carolinensis TaxID=1004156 RepID=A0A1V4AT40_9BACT|nr:MAG: hypothetical protein AYP45_09615 [Candidatus Brocadia caroliniensis]